MDRTKLATAALFAVLAVTCEKKEEAKPELAVQKANREEPVGVLAPRDQVRTILAPSDGDVAIIVKSATAREASDGRKLLVYVGAKWCEPCQHFHRAAARGDLDKAFPNLTLLEFDSDRDGERLLNAGYSARFIPYFGVPGPDGRATDWHFEGAVQGEPAVAEITPRLRALLDR